MQSKAIIKFYLKKLIPPIFFEIRNKIFWKKCNLGFVECRFECTGYDDELTVEKCFRSAIDAISLGKIERDGEILNSMRIDFELLCSLQTIFIETGKLSVVDFGGGFGTSFFQNSPFLNNIKIEWGIVEQAKYVEKINNSALKKKFKGFVELDEAIKQLSPNVILISSVLQYLENPMVFIKNLISLNIDYLIIDRTLFSLNGEAFMSKQYVIGSEYELTYPCWFLSYENLLEEISTKYKLVYEWNSFDKSNLPSEFKGFFFKKVS